MGIHQIANNINILIRQVPYNDPNLPANLKSELREFLVQATEIILFHTHQPSEAMILGLADQIANFDSNKLNDYPKIKEPIQQIQVQIKQLIDLQFYSEPASFEDILKIIQEVNERFNRN
jgi:hypothetical protein